MMKVKNNPEAVTIVSPDKKTRSFCLPSSAARWLQKNKAFESGSLVKVKRVLTEMIESGSPCQGYSAFNSANPVGNY